MLYRVAFSDHCMMVPMVGLQYVRPVENLLQLDISVFGTLMLGSVYEDMRFQLPYDLVSFTMKARVGNILARTSYSLIIANTALRVCRRFYRASTTTEFVLLWLLARNVHKEPPTHIGRRWHPGLQPQDRE